MCGNEGRGREAGSGGFITERGARACSSRDRTRASRAEGGALMADWGSAPDDGVPRTLAVRGYFSPPLPPGFSCAARPQLFTLHRDGQTRIEWMDFAGSVSES